jgi:DNA-directed RNA polymerase specialized sigma subunit
MARTRSKKNAYFTKEHENAIIEYSNTDCRDRRTKLYIELIGPVFDEMVDKIVYTYKFTTLPNIDSLKEECKIWLTTILDKYDPSKGSKAFSYFSVVTKNWFIHKIKKNSKKFRSEVSYEEMLETGSSEIRNAVSKEPSYEELRLEKEFWFLLKDNLDKWNTDKLKENEKKVLEATKVIIDNVDQLEIFNKKAVYLYLREITGLNTKQVVTNLKRIREKYKFFKQKYEQGEI